MRQRPKSQRVQIELPTSTVNAMMMAAARENVDIEDVIAGACERAYAPNGKPKEAREAERHAREDEERRRRLRLTNTTEDNRLPVNDDAATQREVDRLISEHVQ